jgi:hypothetical protein
LRLSWSGRHTFGKWPKPPPWTKPATPTVVVASQALGKKLYGVIYADPPWRYSNPPMGAVARANEQHYPTMEIRDICALPSVETEAFAASGVSLAKIS